MQIVFVDIVCLFKKIVICKKLRWRLNISVDAWHSTLRNVMLHEIFSIDLLTIGIVS